MSDDIARYRDMIKEAVGGFDPKKILSLIKIYEDDAVAIRIPVNQTIYGGHITIQHIDMSIGTVEDHGYYADGDLGVNYVLNEPSDEDEPAMDVDDAMDIFYSNEEYDEDLKEVLMNAGFSQAAVTDVGGSESGMQDEYRASYDAPGLADEVRMAIASMPSSKPALAVGMRMLGARGINPTDPRIDAKKDLTIKWLLGKIKDAGGVQFDVTLMATTLMHHGVKWPELSAILRSAKSAD